MTNLYYIVIGLNENQDTHVEENIDITEMKAPTDHDNIDNHDIDTEKNKENTLNEEANDPILETNIDTVEQVEELVIAETDLANVEQQESTSEEAPKTYAELDRSLINMEPHFFLNKVQIHLYSVSTKMILSNYRKIDHRKLIAIP